jgi:adenylate cyclase
LVAVVAAGLVLLAALTVGAQVLRGLETSSLDLRFRIRGALPPGKEIVLLRVDDRSIATLGRWPFRRAYFADAVRRLHRAGARVIVFDLLLAEPESPIPPELRRAVEAAAAALPGAESEGLRAQLQQFATSDGDADLAAAMREAGNVLLPVAFAFTGQKGEEPDALSQSAYAKFDKSPIAPAFPLQPVSVLMPLPPLAAAAAGLGHVNLAYDRDGAPRYDYLALPFEGDFIPSMPIRAAAAYLGVPWSDVAIAPGTDVRIGPDLVPTDPAMRLLINYRGPPGTFPTYSFADFLAGKVNDAEISGRIVLIGASFTGDADSNAAPFGNTELPGTERMANVIDTILAHDFIAGSADAGSVLVIGAVLVLAAAAGFGAAFLPTRDVFLAGLAPLVLWLGGAQWAILHNLWLPVVTPAASLAAAAAAVVLFRYWVVDREGRAVKSAFRHYLSPAMVSLLASHPERLKLGGETREMTMLFCDVRGFTAISETFKSNPQGLTQLISRFLTPMTDLIMARRGTIDKYMGDCIMAFWNAPLDDSDHARHACQSALAMMRSLEAVNAELEDEARAGEHPFHALKVGIGLNTGDCVVGNMGSDQRFDYSVLGDAVNLASRLEGQSKTYGVGIVIGETTQRQALDFAALELDLIAVKGKDEAVRIYALLGDETMAASAEFKSLAALQGDFLARYRAQEWQEARAALALCRAAEPSLATLHALYDERIGEYEASPPGPDWGGVFVATTK